MTRPQHTTRGKSDMGVNQNFGNPSCDTRMRILFFPPLYIGNEKKRLHSYLTATVIRVSNASHYRNGSALTPPPNEITNAPSKTQPNLAS